MFTAVGIFVPIFLPGLVELEANQKFLLFVAEMGLVLLLFTDASRISPKNLRSLGRLPARLLSIGMLLTILLGAMFALIVFPNLSLWEAGILAAILAPTDAGMVKSISIIQEYMVLG